MPLRIPETFRPAILDIINLTDEKYEALFRALSAAKPVLSMNDLISQVRTQAKVDRAKLESIIRILIVLYSVRGEVPLKKFVNDFCDSARTTLLKDQKHGWDILRKRITHFLKLEKPIVILAKAAEVMTAHEHVFREARIFTDLRPIFTTDPVERPLAATFVHMLKLNYTHGPSKKEFFIAMDSVDIKKLQKVLARALSKEKTLRALAKTTKLPCLDMESFEDK